MTLKRQWKQNPDIRINLQLNPVSIYTKYFIVPLGMALLAVIMTMNLTSEGGDYRPIISFRFKMELRYY